MDLEGYFPNLIFCCIPMIFAFFLYKSWRKLFIGVGSVAVIGAVAGYLIAQNLEKSVHYYHQGFGSFDLYLIIVFFITLIAISMFLMAANYRKIAPNYWSAGVFCVVFLETSNSLFAFYYGSILVFLNFFSADKMLIYIIAALILFGVIVGGTWLNYCKKRVIQGYKPLIYAVVGLYVGAIISFALIYMIVYAYGYIVLSGSTVEKSPQLVSLFKTVPQEYTAYKLNRKEFDEKILPTIDYPFTGVDDWIETAQKTRVVSDEIKANTLKFLDSPQEQELFKSFEKLVEYEQNNPHILFLPILNEYRSYIRYVAGKAALYHYTKQNDKILPLLEESFYKTEQNFNNSDFLIKTLVKRACEILLLSKIVSLGPNNKEAVPVYRRLLNEILNQKLEVYNEEKLLAQNLYYIMNLNYDSQEIYSYKLKKSPLEQFKFDAPREYEKISGYAKFMNHPNLIVHTAKQLSQVQKLPHEEELLALPESAIPELSEEARVQYNFICRFYSNRNAAILGLALKIYRCENGRYPTTLEELVPKYLEKLPDEIELKVELTPEEFTIKRASNNIEIISSKILY